MNETNIYIVKFKKNPNVVYIGNTHLDINKRLLHHKYHNSSLTKFVNSHNIDWDDVYIELYEIFKYDNRKEYEKKETDVIQLFSNDTNYTVINNNKIGGNITKRILKEVDTYLIDNLKKIIQQNICDYYHLDNFKDYTKIKSCICSNKNYYKNREFKLKQMKEYREKNKIH